ncbi:MAG: CTP synthase, partial [Parcubacteria group bacterium]|nr:CTP synthase [Parcubacteria group bacterium]
EEVANVHVTYVPVPPHIGEPKTKPAQFGLKNLMSMGITANFIVIRSEIPVDDQRKYKFALKFNINKEDIFSNENVDTIYTIPDHLKKQNFDKRLLKYFNLKPKKKLDLSDWNGYVKKIRSKKKKIKIAIVGKYFSTGDSSLMDSYYALLESIQHACIHNNLELDLIPINSEKKEKTMEKELKGIQGIIVPIGWGTRGIEGKIKAIKYARENKVPYLGLCYGMQLAAVEFARNVVGWKDAHTEEVKPKSKHKIIHSIPFNKKYQTIKGDGCSMRLGSFDCILKKDSLAYKTYEKYDGFKDNKKGVVTERHRHRFEFNNEYRRDLEDKGLIISGTSPDDFFVEMIELPKEKHPFFIATQGHPEYKSTPLKPHPLFIEFIKESNKK